MAKAMTVCNVPGCGEIVERGRCPAHERTRRSGHQRDGFYSSAEWKRIRGRYRRLHPTCEDCGGPAVDVHHISGDTSDNRDDNLRSVCKACHAKYTLHPYQQADTISRPRHDAAMRGPLMRQPVVGGGLLDLMRKGDQR
jgi:5-methylcytosine-specific restriction protein A